MNLYAFLVGINSYPLNPLTQCVNDVKKMEDYLNTLGPSFSGMEIKMLFDREATKQAIVAGIGDSFSRATDDDVCLFYYSGHGGQEFAGGRFTDEHDGLLECLVACPEPGQKEGYLLADKEIRYLLTQLPSNPHLVTVFDCCHSGDMVRGMAGEESQSRRKRLSKLFSARDYSGFIFSKALTEKDLKQKSLSEVIPYKNHIHLAACLPDESSWEDTEGGVFTRYLLQLLKSNDNRLNYRDIAKWARVSMMDVTSTRQTPTFSIQGTGKVRDTSSWLNLFPEDCSPPAGKLIYNYDSCWNYTRGQLMGIKEGMPIKIYIDGNKTKFIESVITKVKMESSEIEDPMKNNYQLDTNREYDVSTDTTFSKPTLYINNLENETELQAAIEKMIRTGDLATLAVSGKASDYFINIFNGMIYLTQRDDEFRPLAEQIDLLVHENDYLYVLKNQLVAVSRWHHFHTLTNPDNEFDEVPLKVELRLGKEKPFEEITGKSFELNPKSNRLSINEEPLMYRNFEVKITNISDHELHVAVLVLNSDFSITTTPLNDQVIKLGPGESKFFNEHKNSVSKIIFDQYKEIYNWKSEWFHYKFIFNNYEDFTTSLADFRQEALKNPILPVFLKRRFRGAKSEGGSYEEKEDVVERWGTSISTIHLKNPGYNIVPDKVNRNWKNFSSDNRIAPFIGQLYYDSRFDGLVIRSQSKTNRLEEGRADRGLGEIKVNVGNFLDNARRRRIFERAKRKMPGKPVVIAEGDSWFLYPFLVKDTIDYVMEDFPVRSIAAAGDTLENYKNSNQLLTETADIRPEFVLISGGGNDIIGPEIVDILKKNAGKGLLPQEYLNEKYPERRKKLIELYSYFFEELRKHHSVKHIFVHGYDYVRADQPEEVIQKGWVNKYMIEYGIKNAGDRERLIRYLVDNFNSDLEELVSKYDHVSYLNMRGLVNENEWYDEIHPNDAGFGKVGSQFINAIKQF